MNLNKFSEEYAAETGGRCLDGTPATYYYAEGSTDKAVVFLEGGGYCYGYGDTWGGDFDCDERKNGQLGTSNGLGETTSLPVLDSEVFDGWHKVFIPYCTGDLWSGV